MNRILLASAAAAWLAGFQLGYDIALMASMLEGVQRSLELCACERGDDACDCLLKQLAASLMSMGSIFGASLSGWLADTAGRRRGLLAADACFLATGLLMFFATSAPVFCVGRFAAGVANGIASSVAFTYLSEVSPKEMRGRLMQANELMVSVGCETAFLICWLVGSDNWRLAVLPIALAGVAQALAVLSYVPESPRWLAYTGKHEEAQAIAAQLGFVSQMKGGHLPPALDGHAGPYKFTLRETLRQLWAERSSVSRAFALCLCHCLVWAVAVSTYSAILFRRGGIQDPLGANTLLGIAKAAGALLAFWLIERMGRRRLLLIGTSLVLLCHVALSASFGAEAPYGVLLSMLVLVLGWSMSYSGLMLSVAAELLPLSVRGSGVGLAFALFCVVTFVQQSVFLDLAGLLSLPRLGACMCLSSGVAWLTVFLYIPETRGELPAFRPGDRMDVATAGEPPTPPASPRGRGGGVGLELGK